jgi:hypothetical protein
MAQRKATSEEQQTNANVRRLDAGTVRETQATEQAAEAHPLNMDKARKDIEALEARIAAARTTADKDALEIKKEKLLIDVQEKTGLDRAKAEIAVRRAQAAQAGAGAAENRAQARGATAEAEQKERINELEKKILAKQPLTPEEKDILARHRVGKGDLTSANVLLRNSMRESLQKAYPGKSESEYEQMLLKLESSKKGANMEVIKAALESGDKGLEERGRALLREALGEGSPSGGQSASGRLKRYNPATGKIE